MIPSMRASLSVFLFPPFFPPKNYSKNNSCFKSLLSRLQVCSKAWCHLTGSCKKPGERFGTVLGSSRMIPLNSFLILQWAWGQEFRLETGLFSSVVSPFTSPKQLCILTFLNTFFFAPVCTHRKF